MNAKAPQLRCSLDAHQALDRMVAKANESFTGGRITKPELLSWLVIHFEKDSFNDSLPTIQSELFDHMAYLSHILKEAKKARKDGQTSPELSAIITKLQN